MKMILKLFLVLTVAACGLAQNKDKADYWQDLYDSQWYDEEIGKLELDSFEWGDSKDIDGQNTNIKNAGSNELGNDEKDTEEDTSHFGEAEQSNQSKEVDQKTAGSISQEESKPEIGNYKIEDTNDNDYVLEDNRFISEEKLASDENLTDKEPETIDLDPIDEIKESVERKNDKIDDYVVEDNRLLYKDENESLNTMPVINEENVDAINTADDTEKIVDVKFGQQESGEFQNHLSNKNEQESIDDDSEPDMDKDKALQDTQIENSSKQENTEGNQKILEETKLLSETIDSSFGNSNEDNVGKIDDDLDYDLNELFKTFDKLSEDAQVETQKPLFEVDKPEAVQGEIADYEEKYGRPYNEGSILKMRQDYEDSINNQDNWDDYQISTENQQNNGNDEQDDLNIDEILKKLDKELEQDADDDLDRDKKIYENDALLTDEDVKKSSDSVERQDVAKTDDDDANITEAADQFPEVDSEPQPIPVKEMTSAELKSEIGKLTRTYVDELDINSDSFDRNVAPIHITLKIDEAVEITSSPDYPEFYPTNNIIDWIFEGDGMGIELNISDLSLNGFAGDYLLVKPGGIDHTGQDGLVFSFHLNGERRYRFLDVNRMFVRFRAHPGMPFARGFKLSVKLVGPKLELPEPIPTPTPAPELPQETLTIFFEGLVAEEFRNRSEEFRSIIADMATMYINRHGIEPGYEATINVTQITRIVECNINWPGHEPCAAVTFGVPLDYAEDQDYRLTKNELEYMWFSYSYIDPFAARLRRMGLSEFAIPNEGTVIMAWVVIFFGVLISALMLGFAVWRWNCFEGYSRMPLYTDTDSIISGKKKDDLDLYPTPHQNLPPLYSDGHYEDRWNGNAQYDNTSRVDMGGYSNKSYVRENELVDIDSDDDVIMALPGQKDSRNEGLTITSKHIFEV